ncbi:MAG: cytochrome [Frankiales bacterium]|nr:cytochrome [Frankiales bacterium]
MRVDELELPTYDDLDAASDFHAALRELSEQSWIARGALGYAVFDHEAGNALLRDRRMAFPAIELLVLQGVTSGPIWDRNQNGLMGRSGEPHTRLRRMLAPAFTPRAAERLRPQLTALVEELWAPVQDQGRCEFVSTLAEPLPSRAIAALLDVPGDAPTLARWSVLLQEVFKMRLAEVGPQVEQAYAEVREYVVDLLERRRAHPGEDLASVLATAGEKITDDEAAILVSSVISGGTDTTTAQLAHGLRLFAEHPDQWQALREDPSLIDQAVEEVLRYEPITPFTARIAREDVELRDVTMPAGTVVFVCAATANRDPQVFEEPERFDITRDRGTSSVLTFGFGAHYCVGAYLARAEMVETFRYLAPRTPDLALDGEPVLGPTTGIYAVESLPLSW